MKYDFKRTFNDVRLTDKRQEEIKTELLSCLEEKQKEHLYMNEKIYSFRKSRVLVIAVVTLLALSMVGFAYGSDIIKLLGGGKLEQGETGNGESFISMDMGFNIEAVKIEDDQIYFILDGSNTNITSQCSQSDYFKYEVINKAGHRNVVVIGGTADNIGMAEFVWDKNGEFKGSNASYKGEEEPQWLKLANKELRD